MERSQHWPIAALAVFIVAVSCIPVPAMAEPPAVTEIQHMIKYPHKGDLVNITARVESAVAVKSVTVFYCAIGGWVCQHWTMFDLDSDHVYNQTATPDYVGSIGGDYYIVAIDANDESTMTNYTYVQYALSINSTLTSDRQEVYPGGKFNLTLQSHYWNNYSAPTENSSVDINRVGSAEHWTGKTDSTGNLTMEITAPSTVGTYVYNATITNQSEMSGHVVTGYAEVSVLVLIEPMPDLIVRPQDIVHTPMNPYEGDNVTANITVRNIGNEDETFRILVVLRAGGVDRVLKNVSMTLHAWNETDNSTTIAVSWDAHLGVQELNVTLDPGNPNREASEDNNFASAFITGVVRPTPTNGDQPIPLYIWVMTIVILLAVVGAVIAMVMRRKRPQGKTEEPAEDEKGSEQ